MNLSNVEAMVRFLNNEFEIVADPSKASQMSAYMKHHFNFYGVKKPIQKEIFKKFKSTFDINDKSLVRELIINMWECEERELHYIAIELLKQNKKMLEESDIPMLELLLSTNAWWDSVDMIATHAVGYLLAKDKQLEAQMVKRWSSSENLWLNRTTIIYQLKYREKTDRSILKQQVLRFRTHDDFFIKKAIGWALREYAKTDPFWVKTLANSIELAPLSRREALKHIGN